MNTDSKQELIQTINKSRMQVLFFLCALIISVLFSIYYYIELIKTSKSLEESNANLLITNETLERSKELLEKKNKGLIEISNDLEKQKDKLTISKEALEVNKKELEVSENRYRTFIDTAIAAQDGDAAEKTKYTTALKDASTLLYHIEFIVKGFQEREVEKVTKQLVEQGYIIADITYYDSLSYEPDWISKKPTIFYYDKFAKQDAATIANQIKKLTDITFEISHGHGRGVVDDLKRWTIYVHLVK